MFCLSVFDANIVLPSISTKHISCKLLSWIGSISAFSLSHLPILINFIKKFPSFFLFFLLPNLYKGTLWTYGDLAFWEVQGEYVYAKAMFQSCKAQEGVNSFTIWEKANKVDLCQAELQNQLVRFNWQNPQICTQHMWKRKSWWIQLLRLEYPVPLSPPFPRCHNRFRSFPRIWLTG